MYQLPLLIVGAIHVCSSQKILKFEIQPDDTTCTEVNGLRQSVDEILFLVTLDYQDKVQLQSWFIFTINYIDRKNPDHVATAVTVNLMDCDHNVKSDQIFNQRCVVMNDRIYLTFALPALPKYNQSSFYGQWVSLRHGSVRSDGFLAGPNIVVNETESLTLNEHDMMVSASSLRLKDGEAVHTKYCVSNIMKHTLLLKFNETQKTSEEGCLEVEFVAMRGQVLTAGFDETEGPCKQTKRHYYDLRAEGDMILFYKRPSTSRGFWVNTDLKGLFQMFTVAVLVYVLTEKTL